MTNKYKQMSEALGFDTLDNIDLEDRVVLNTLKKLPRYKDVLLEMLSTTKLSSCLNILFMKMNLNRKAAVTFKDGAVLSIGNKDYKTYSRLVSA